MAGLTVHSSEFAKLEVSADGGSTWKELPGVNSYTESGGEAPTRDVVAFGGVSQRTGIARLPTIEIGAIVPPMHSTWLDLAEAFREGNTRQFRLQTKSEILFGPSKSGVTAAVAVSGAVTFVGDGANFRSDDFGVGMAIAIGASNPVQFIIESITSAGVVTVSPAPSSAVAPAVYMVGIPALQRGPFTAKVRLADRATLAAEGDLTQSITLAPIADLPDWEVM